MRVDNQKLLLSAHDLVGHLNCQTLTQMDADVAFNKRAKPAHWDPLLEILWERGLRHERAYLDYLRENGFETVLIDGVDITDAAVELTLEAMREGVEVIVQAALRRDQWVGRADILFRVDRPSAIGDWSYEVVDTKLARETKGGTVLQLCLYADLLTSMQGVEPEYVYVVAPWSNFERQAFRVSDFNAFFRKAKRATEEASVSQNADAPYPDPKEHCDICRWSEECDAKRRTDDHLCLVANISKSQIQELQAHDIFTAKALSELPSPLPWKPYRGSLASYERTVAQARIQVIAREAGEMKFELLDLIPGSGLFLLPEPSVGDVFFDLEGDPFIGPEGREYLFGYHYRDNYGGIVRKEDWAFDREAEKAAFERFLDLVSERRARYPDMHVYHYAPYEPATLKRLMGRYATREAELDNLLRSEVFVDLYAVVRNAIRASVESYSIKKLEPFYGFQRSVNLRNANIALTTLAAWLELKDDEAISEDVMSTVAGYNGDDCFSTEALRSWLEDIRKEAIAGGAKIDRPNLVPGDASDDVSDHEARVASLIETLTHDVPADVEERSVEQQARWILAYLLDWHRREEKAVWWEFFRLRDLTPIELIDEKAGLGGLEFVDRLQMSPRGVPTDRYSFADQDTDIRVGDDLKTTDGNSFGKVEAISQENRTVDIRKSVASADVHPEATFAHTYIATKEQVDALLRLGDYVAANGIEGEGEYQAARDMLLCLKPRLYGQPLQTTEETTLQAALRITPYLGRGVLPIQGPPGTGKSFTGAHIIRALLDTGKSVGITANSHKVIRNLIDKTVDVSLGEGKAIKAAQKLSSKETDGDHVKVYTDNNKTTSAVRSGSVELLGGTAFFWARADAASLVDVLVVDEAAQMSLANVLAVSQAAPQMILLGDPQQLDQPMQGSHPDGTGLSALDHILQGHQTIGKDHGLFLEKTWRLHPDITQFNSELFYESKLTSQEGCINQNITASGRFAGTGLRYVAVNHTGNQSRSHEEADAVKAIVEEILGSGTTWTDRNGQTRPVTEQDIIIIAPYNAQVFEIQKRLPTCHVGTVDKFQGQEAPIAIYSMATSSYTDAPRGMEFLYSANRLNVAISRAKCMAILVASPMLFEVQCKTPRQMQLANAFCRYLEMAVEITH